MLEVGRRFQTQGAKTWRDCACVWGASLSVCAAGAGCRMNWWVLNGATVFAKAKRASFLHGMERLSARWWGVGAQAMAIGIDMDVSSITHSVQLAVAPVFFLTAVAGMIGAVAGRLARIIDRARVMEERVRSSGDAQVVVRALRELSYLRTRGRIANWSIGLLTLCGFLIGLTIAFLFVGQAWNDFGPHWAMTSFFGGVVSFMAALACFMWETVLATQILDFNALKVAKRDT